MSFSLFGFLQIFVSLVISFSSHYNNYLLSYDTAKKELEIGSYVVVYTTTTKVVNNFLQNKFGLMLYLSEFGQYAYLCKC